MKSIEEVLEQNENIYLWEDDRTLDISYDNTTEFIKLIKDQKCLRCDTHLVHNNQHILTALTPNVNGVNIMCRECGQHYFVHKIIKFLS